MFNNGGYDTSSSSSCIKPRNLLKREYNLDFHKMMDWVRYNLINFNKDKCEMRVLGSFSLKQRGFGGYVEQNRII